ncbi:esterase FrsA [Streptomyces sp. XM83C]|jgi:pimeloyl-ACP methyl ester carboxylesterase|uniref:Alpha/beta fold hydrolase n=1 Tax=Streptomyces thermocoprophilus TaxID=78356 RepID=A0ABV5V974_9ACTN|nr:alpha/beta fold hydrolase [Streptomyces sp. XM83C]MCK1822840.1 esterase FrsA [Streptomyces sp. XM83C]
MDHLDELKEFARLHARGQGLTAEHTDAVLRRITNDTPGDPASWAAVWTAEGRAAADRGDLLDACRHYALARFPHPHDDDRRLAQQLGVTTFDTWRRDAGTGIERLTLTDPDGAPYACWAAGLDRDKPLLVVCGGIVSVKEQWAPLLPLLRKLGFAAVVTELPGVGEHDAPYRPGSWRTLSDLLDRLATRADVSDTSFLALSFSGHLALRTAAEDPRVRRVLTVGAPVADFFTDTQWWPRVPRITVDTLTRLTGSADETELRALLPEFALGQDLLAGLDLPVRYVASARDEIIPPREQALLRRALPDVKFKVFDDVHGSPAHLGAMRRWLFTQLLLLRITRRRVTRQHTSPTPLSRRQP